MQDVRWVNQATREAFEALISQPEAIHVPCTPYPDEPKHEFADRLRTIIAALIRAVDEFGLDGRIHSWLSQVEDWATVEWQKIAALLVDRAKGLASSCPADHRTAIAA